MTEKDFDKNFENNEKKRLTDFQLRLVQAAAGIISAAALILSIYFSNATFSSNNILLQYLFIIVFVIIMIVRRQVEAKLRIRMSFFNLVLIDGILVGMLLFLILYPESAKKGLSINDTLIYVIIAGISLIIAVVGVLLPLLRYLKRKANDTLLPIRIPEVKKAEPSESPVGEDTDYRSLTTAQRIELMTKELEPKEIFIKREEEEKEE